MTIESGNKRNYIVQYKLTADAEEFLTKIKTISEPVEGLAKKVTAITEGLTEITRSAQIAKNAMKGIDRITPKVDLTEFKRALANMEFNASRTAAKIRNIMEASLGGSRQNFDTAYDKITKGTSWKETRPIDRTLERQTREDARLLKALQRRAQLVGQIQAAEGGVEKWFRDRETRYRTLHNLPSFSFTPEEKQKLMSGEKVTISRRGGNGVNTWIANPIKQDMIDSERSLARYKREYEAWNRVIERDYQGLESAKTRGNKILRDLGWNEGNQDAFIIDKKGSFESKLGNSGDKAIKQMFEKLRGIRMANNLVQQSRDKAFREEMTSIGTAGTGSFSDLASLMSEGDIKGMAKGYTDIAKAFKGMPSEGIAFNISANVSGNYTEHMPTLGAFLDRFAEAKSGKKNLSITAKVNVPKDQDVIKRMVSCISAYNQIAGVGKTKAISVTATLTGIPSNDVLGRLEKLGTVFNALVSGTKQIDFQAKVKGISEKQLEKLTNVGKKGEKGGKQNMIELVADIKGLQEQIKGHQYTAEVTLIPNITKLQEELKTTPLIANANIQGVAGSGGGGPGKSKGAARGGSKNKDWRIDGTAMSSIGMAEYANNVRNQINFTEAERLKEMAFAREAFNNNAYGPGMESSTFRKVWYEDQLREEKRVKEALNNLLPSSVSKRTRMQMKADAFAAFKNYDDTGVMADYMLRKTASMAEESMNITAKLRAIQERAAERAGTPLRDFIDKSLGVNRHIPNHEKRQRELANAFWGPEARQAVYTGFDIMDFANGGGNPLAAAAMNPFNKTIAQNMRYEDMRKKMPIYEGMPTHKISAFERESFGGYNPAVSPRTNPMAMSADEYLSYQMEMEQQAQMQAVQQRAYAERMREAAGTPLRDAIERREGIGQSFSALSHNQRQRMYEKLDWDAYDRAKRLQQSRDALPETLARQTRKLGELQAKAMNGFAKYTNSATEQRELLKHRRFFINAQRLTGFDAENASIFDQLEYLEKVREMMDKKGVLAPNSLNKRIKDLQKKSQINPEEAAKKVKAFRGKDRNSWRSILYSVAGNTSIGANTPAAIEMAKGFGVAYAAGGAMGMMGNALGEAVDYQNTMETTRSILKRGYVGGNFGRDFNVMEKEARKVGMETKYTAPEVAGAAKFMAMAGLGINDIKGSIAPVADIALIGDNDLSEVADKITNIQTAFGIKGGNKMRRVADQMANTFTQTNTDMMMIAESMQYAAPMAHLAGANVGDVLAMIGVMGNAGIQASTAGTTMRMMYQNIINPNKNQRKVWEWLGIKRMDANGAPRNMIDILNDIAKSDKVGDNNLAEVVSKLFRVTASAGAGQLIEDLRSKNSLVMKIRNENAGTGIDGVSENLADTKKNTIAGLWAQVTSAFTEDGVQMFERFQGTIKELLIDVRDWLQSDDAINALRSFLEILRDIGGAMKFFVDIYTKIFGGDNAFSSALRFAVKWLVIFQFGISQVGQALKLVASVVNPFYKLFMKFLAFKGLDVSKGLFGLFKDAGGIQGVLTSFKGSLVSLINPLGLATAALVGLGAVTYSFYNNTKKAEDHNKKVQNALASHDKYAKKFAGSQLPEFVDYSSPDRVHGRRRFATLKERFETADLFLSPYDRPNKYVMADRYLGGRSNIKHSDISEDVRRRSVLAALYTLGSNKDTSIASHRYIANLFKGVDSKDANAFKKAQEQAKAYAEKYNPDRYKGLIRASEIKNTDEIGNIDPRKTYEWHKGLYQSLLNDASGKSVWTQNTKGIAGLKASTTQFSENWWASMANAINGMKASINTVKGAVDITIQTLPNGKIDTTSIIAQVSKIVENFKLNLSSFAQMVSNVYATLVSAGAVDGKYYSSWIGFAKEQTAGKAITAWDAATYYDEYIANGKNPTLEKMGRQGYINYVTDTKNKKAGKQRESIRKAKATKAAIEAKNNYDKAQKDLKNSANALIGGDTTDNSGKAIPDFGRDKGYDNKYGRTSGRPTQVNINIDKLAQFDHSQFLTADEQKMQAMIGDSTNDAMRNLLMMLGPIIQGMTGNDSGYV